MSRESSLDLKNTPEMQDYSVYRAAGSAHSAAHKASLHSLSPLELTHLSSPCQSSAHRPHTCAPIDGGARTCACTPTLCQKEITGGGHSCSLGGHSGKSAPLLLHVSWKDVWRFLCSHAPHQCTYGLQDPHQSTQDKACFPVSSEGLTNPNFPTSSPLLPPEIRHSKHLTQELHFSLHLRTEFQTFHWFRSPVSYCVPLGPDPLLLHLHAEELPRSKHLIRASLQGGGEEFWKCPAGRRHGGPYLEPGEGGGEEGLVLDWPDHSITTGVSYQCPHLPKETTTPVTPNQEDFPSKDLTQTKVSMLHNFNRIF